MLLQNQAGEEYRRHRRCFCVPQHAVRLLVWNKLEELFGTMGLKCRVPHTGTLCTLTSYKMSDGRSRSTLILAPLGLPVTVLG